VQRATERLGLGLHTDLTLDSPASRQKTMRMLHLLTKPEARTISGLNQIPGQPRKQKPEATVATGDGEELKISNNLSKIISQRIQEQVIRSIHSFHQAENHTRIFPSVPNPRYSRDLHLSW